MSLLEIAAQIAVATAACTLVAIAVGWALTKIAEKR